MNMHGAFGQHWFSNILATAFLAFSFVGPAFCGNADPNAIAANPDSAQRPGEIVTGPFRSFAAGFSGGSFGVGGQFVTTLSRRTNLRLDGKFFSFSDELKQDGITYRGDLRLFNVRAMYDLYPFGNGFRVSGGAALYSSFSAKANTLVPAQQTINFNGADYYSSASDPLHGNARLGFGNRVAPVVTVGWGDTIPRLRRHHLSFPVEFGVAYTGAPQFQLVMTGSACSTPNPETCSVVNKDQSFESNVAAEQRKIQKDVRFLRWYPICEFGVGYRF